MELIGLYLIGAGLLVVAGVAKTLRPDDTARAVSSLVPGRTPRPLQSLGFLRQLVRVLALTEVAVGLAALARTGPVTGALVASSYVLFACVVAYARLRGGPLATCGCFGRPDTPATWLHVVLNLALAWRLPRRGRRQLVRRREIHRRRCWPTNHGPAPRSSLPVRSAWG